MVPILGTPSRVSEVLRGKKGEHGDGAAAARPFPRVGRPPPSAAQEGTRPPREEASRSLMVRGERRHPESLPRT